MGPSNARSDLSDGVPEQRLISCWACDVTLELPNLPKNASHVKCGWCGAVSQVGNQPSTPEEKKRLPCHRCHTCCYCFGQGIIVCVVLLLLTSVVVLGYVGVLNHLFRSTAGWMFNGTVAAVASFNVFFNYFAAIIRGPGYASSTLPHGIDEKGRVLPGLYEGYLWCSQCNGPKPPSAHHCSTCRKCVLGMDHHCPFIGTCVGRNNLRNFLLFLFWVVAGAVYAISLSGWLVVRSNSTKLAVRHALQHKWYLGAFNMLVYYVDSAPWWVVAAWYVFSVAASGFIGVGVLLLSQVQQVCRGQTYIQTLKGQAGTMQESRLEHFRRIFGMGHPALWILPHWGSPAWNLTTEEAIRKSL